MTSSPRMRPHSSKPLFEVRTVPPNVAFAKRFRSGYRKALFRKFRKRGLSPNDSKDAVRAVLGELRSMLHRNMRFRSLKAAPNEGKNSTDS